MNDTTRPRVAELQAFAKRSSEETDETHAAPAPKLPRAGRRASAFERAPDLPDALPDTLPTDVGPEAA